MGRGAWWAIFHGVMKRWTRLSDYTAQWYRSCEHAISFNIQSKPATLEPIFSVL